MDPDRVTGTYQARAEHATTVRAWQPGARDAIRSFLEQPPPLAGGAGTTYYIDPAGDDANPGTSPGRPWRTIAKANAFAFQTGDEILLRRCCTWPEQMNVTTAGIGVGAYGSSPPYRDFTDWDALPKLVGTDAVNPSAFQVYVPPNVSGPELLTNGSFDAWTAGTPDGWTVTTTGGGDPTTVTQETTFVHTAGGSSVHMHENAGGDIVAISQTVNLPTGVEYLFKVWGSVTAFENLAMRAHITGGPLSGYYLQTDGSWAPVTSGRRSPINQQGQWLLTQLIFAVPSAAGATANVIIEFNRVQANTEIYLDDASLSLFASPPIPGLYRAPVSGSVQNAFRDGVRGTVGALRTLLNPQEWVFDTGYLYVQEPDIDPSLGGVLWRAATRDNAVNVTAADVTIRDVWAYQSGTNGIVGSVAENLTVAHCRATSCCNANFSGANGSIASSGQSVTLQTAAFFENLIEDSGTDGMYCNNVLKPVVKRNRVVGVFGHASDICQFDYSAGQWANAGAVVVGNYGSNFATNSPKGGIISVGGANGYFAHNYMEYGNWCVSTSGSHNLIEWNVGYRNGVYDPNFGASFYVETNVPDTSAVPPWPTQITDNEWRHNVSIDANTGFVVFAFNGGSPTRTNFRFYNNTVVGATRGFQISGAMTFTGDFRNNILWGCQYAIWMTSTGSCTLTSDYNIVGPEAVGFVRSSAGVFDTLAAYRTATSRETHSLTADPLFVNDGGTAESGADYMLQAGSPALHAGVDVGREFAGSAPSIGAFDGAPVQQAGRARKTGVVVLR